MEYSAAFVAIASLAVLKALTAKYDLLTIPWIEVIRKPIYFGGAREVRRGAIYLASWIASSLIISLIITFVLKNSSGIVQYIYDSIGYDNEGVGTVGLITIVFINIILYLHLVNKTRNLVKKRSRDLPENSHLWHPFGRSCEEVPETRKELALFFLRNIYYLAPSLLSNIYQFFYFESSHLLHGAARLAFDQCGKDIILNFIDHHIENLKSADTATTDLSDLLKREHLKDYDRALALLETCIENHGYNSTNKYISNYLQKLRDEPQYGIDRRSVKRTQLEKHKYIKFLNGGSTYNASIPEYSNDFSGLYLATKAFINSNQDITLMIEDLKCDARIIHKNTLISCSKRYKGCGIFISEEATRLELECKLSM